MSVISTKIYQYFVKFTDGRSNAIIHLITDMNLLIYLLDINQNTF